MTPQHTYSIKEMLEKMEERSVIDRGETNKKIDDNHTDVMAVINNFRTESLEADEDQDKRIGVLEHWKSFATGAVWFLGGSGALTGLFFLYNWFTNNV